MALFGGITLPKSPNLENARRLDLMVVPTLRRMMRAGFAIDKPYLIELGSIFAGEMRELAKDIASYVPVDALDRFISAETEGEDAGTINPGSPEQISTLLFDVLEIGKDKSKLKRTKKGALSTGKRQLETLRYDHPVIVKVLQYREVSKLRSTYTQKLPAVARFHPRGNSCPICERSHSTDQWRVHGEIGQTRAATWRFNHKNPNLGNIPTRTENGQMVQAGFIAPEGKILVGRDLSQIELRGLAHLARCQSMIDVYNAGGDIHDDTARRVFGLAPDVKPDKIKHRMAAKRVSFGIMNGSTEKGLYLQLVSDYGIDAIPIPDWLTEEWCKSFISNYLDSRPEVREYFHRMWYTARRYELVWNEFGFCRPIPEVRSTHSWIREAGLRQAQNMPITSLAAGQMKLTMARCDYILDDLYREDSAWPLMTVHDALMFEVDEDRASDVEEMTAWAFDGCMDDESTGERLFRVPISSDGACVYRWVK